ncbi:MAG: SDR family oxidoreductase [Granulosicoccus sp.]|nr:SDR family oxidoreductase [Granulosicoccus sp.]
MISPVAGISGKIALVTGASSGLGAHFSRVLAHAGGHVVLAARRLQKLEVLRANILAEGGLASVVTMDVSDAESVSIALKQVLEEVGPLQILVNNAGVADSKTFLKQEESSWQRTLDVNLMGAWRVAQQVTSQMVATQGSGVVVNIASILGLRVGYGNSAYAISKAGLVQMTRAMALELGPRGIRVNALCPGYFSTSLNERYFSSPQGIEYIKSTPAGRTGKLSELDGPLLLLCGDAGSFINGVALPVDGGHMVSSL